MFPKTPSFLYSLCVNDQVSHPYKTTGKIKVLYILIFKFLDSNASEKSLGTTAIDDKAPATYSFRIEGSL